MTNTPLRFGIIGAGIMGTRHAAWLNNNPTTDVVAVSDLREDAPQELAGKVDAKVYTDYEKMLSAEHLDGIVSVTPDQTHRAPFLASVDAGPMVIIQEKPLATTVEDARVMHAAAEHKGVKVFMGFVGRFFQTDMATKYALSQGLIGDPVYAEVRLDDNICVPTEMWGDRSQEWAGASSTAHFLLSHVVDMLRWHFASAEVESVYAVKVQKVLGYCPDLYDAFLTFDNGLRARVKSEWIKHLRELVEYYVAYTGTTGQVLYNKRPGYGTDEGLMVYCTDQDVAHDQLLACQQFLLDHDIFADVVSEIEAQSGKRTPRHALEVRPFIYPPCEPVHAFHYYLQSLREGQDVPTDWQGFGGLPTGYDGLKSTEVVCAIVQSAEEGREVSTADL